MNDGGHRIDAVNGGRFLLGILLMSCLLSIAVSQIALGVGVLILAWLSVRGRGPARLGIEWPALAMVLWAMAMIPLSGDVHQSLVFSRRWYLLAALWVGSGLAPGEIGRRRLLAALSLAAFAATIIGFIHLLHWGGPRVDEAGVMVGRNHLLQSYMTGAGLMMLAGLVLLAGILTLPRGLLRAVVALTLVLVLATLLFSMTRSAWLGFLAGAAVIIQLRFRRGIVVLAAVVAVAYFLLPGVMKERFGSIIDPSVESNVQRVVMWQRGWELIGAHPWTGVGDRDLAGLEDRALGGTIDWGHLHDNFLMFAVLWGVPGLLLCTVFLLGLGMILLRRWRLCAAGAGGGGSPNAKAGRDAWTLGAIGAWTGFMVSGLFEWNFGDAEVVTLLWLICGIALASRPAPDQA